jgi:acetyl-CoA decarbonylase/synthase complex subunit gamma
MAKKLSGMDIFKLLPKTNCGECGVPTCMAFAMKLAQKTAELSVCPYAGEEAKTVIGAASEPPIRLVKFGAGKRTVETNWCCSGMKKPSCTRPRWLCR